MDAPSGEMNFTRLEKVLFGPGKIGAIGTELDERGCSRALIVTGQSLARSGLVARVADALGGRCAGIYDRAAQHVPSGTVRALAGEIERLDADCVVSFGGGSPIDTSKVAIASVLNGRDMTREARELDRSSAKTPVAGSGKEILHVAVPTTLSAGEYTSGGGVTNEETHIKRGVFDSRLQARIVINDPELTLATPDWLWVSTGIRALDHAVEAIYSVRHQEFTDALAVRAIRLLVEHLRGSVEAGGSKKLAHRGYCQTAAWLSLFGGLNTGLGVSHAFGHQIGPKWNVPHGVTSCITLPHAMRFVAGIAPERFARIAEGLEIAFDSSSPHRGAAACADEVAAFIAGFDVPQSLKAVGIGHNEGPAIAQAVCEEINRFDAVGRAVALDEVLALLQRAYEDPPTRFGKATPMPSSTN